MKSKIFILLLSIVATSSVSCSTLAKIQITPIGTTITENEAKSFKVVGFDKNGKKVKINPNWSLDTGGEDIGTLTLQSNTEAIFQSKDFGVAVITVEDRKIKASAKIFIAKKRVFHMPQK
jgi:hypothetical protein